GKSPPGPGPPRRRTPRGTSTPKHPDPPSSSAACAAAYQAGGPEPNVGEAASARRFPATRFVTFQTERRAAAAIPHIAALLRKRSAALRRQALLEGAHQLRVPEHVPLDRVQQPGARELPPRRQRAVERVQLEVVAVPADGWARAAPARAAEIVGAEAGAARQR